MLFCSGQVHYDLLQRKEEMQDKQTAIVRIEQLYPFPEEQVLELIGKLKPEKTWWVQEEPANMGAAGYIRLHWPAGEIGIISRPASAATAVGYKKVHDQQLKDILDVGFA